MTYEIRPNMQFNSFEIYFDEKPNEAIRSALKALKFRWHKIKKCWYGFADNVETLDDILNGKKVVETIPKAKTKAQPVNKYGVKVGDVFYNSWGYEQTNIDFWQVTGLRGTTQIVLKAIGSERVKTLGFCSEMVKPVKNAWTKHYDGEQITKTVKGTTEQPYCSMDHGLLYKTSWDAMHNETSYY